MNLSLICVPDHLEQMVGWVFSYRTDKMWTIPYIIFPDNHKYIPYQYNSIGLRVPSECHKDRMLMVITCP